MEGTVSTVPFFIWRLSNLIAVVKFTFGLLKPPSLRCKASAKSWRFCSINFRQSILHSTRQWCQGDNRTNKEILIMDNYLPNSGSTDEKTPIGNISKSTGDLRSRYTNKAVKINTLLFTTSGESNRLRFQRFTNHEVHNNHFFGIDPDHCLQKERIRTHNNQDNLRSFRSCR